VAENAHAGGILDVSIAPARSSACQLDSAQEIAERIAAELGYIGTMAVEFFVSRGALYVNEMAPRPHNSGHYTVDACVTSQYEQQVRALCGLPLGDARAHSAAVMVNLLGDIWYDASQPGPDSHGAYREPDWSRLLSVPNLKLHLYGKHHARPGRKMGHFTVVDADPARALEVALAARAAIGIRDQA
jgi:5-(carboxyamino)imidazole ribonucleotide synthase